MFIANAFSLQMLSQFPAHIDIEEVATSAVAKLDLQSAIGHADTAVVLSGILGKDIESNRVNVQLQPGDSLIVAQLMGGRLPEGSTTLPAGFSFKFFKVTVQA
ncbi:protein of unknown function DUF1874 [Thermoanaerobacterium phage THSA-485A]|uniref:Uncharacterized protein n=1 Tax=Thermoanaerobacterium phage THSA-485A TaxID=1126885 RepID=I3VYU1_9CAUD|nr:protein of unknown function DUF1874 [Thermoanaerobacterium phage THSA-485A]AFK87686.1 protein of unknown function DUF1874 [Thermoanaerobacterium phage THSA-485A]